jgi:hypothetical protein
MGSEYAKKKTKKKKKKKKGEFRFPQWERSH